VGVQMEARIRGEHVVVAAPGMRGHFELMERGAFHPAVAGMTSPYESERADGDRFLGYYVDNLAVRLAAGAEPERAERAFRMAIAAAPRVGRLRFNYGTFLLNHHGWQSAAAELRKAVRIDPAQVDAWTNLGVAQAHAGRPRDARR